jgi:hypothetical protein
MSDPEKMWVPDGRGGHVLVNTKAFMASQVESRRGAAAAVFEAEMAALKAAGHVFGGCDPRDEPPEGFDEKALLKRVRAEVKARNDALCAEGLHFVSCGHTPSNSSLKRQGF